MAESLGLYISAFVCGLIAGAAAGWAWSWLTFCYMQWDASDWRKSLHALQAPVLFTIALSCLSCIFMFLFFVTISRIIV